MISLGYYGGMAFFIGFINDLPKISWGVFNFSIIRKGFSYLVDNCSRDKMGLSGANLNLKDEFVNNGKLKDVLLVDTNRGRSNLPAGVKGLYGNSGGSSRGGPTRGSSAAVKGLYGQGERSAVRSGGFKNKIF